MKEQERSSQAGFALITVLMLMVMLSAMLGAYYVLTRVELSTTQSSMDISRGFYAAEAGVNLRAEEIRALFDSFVLPAGSPPPEVIGQLPCEGANRGNGDFGCRSYPFHGREARTYVVESPDNPATVTIPPGEPFQNLQSREFDYTVRSVSVNSRSWPEAILELKFKSRLVPLFQFAVFFDKDLEITPGPPMTITGAVHSNTDLYGSTNEGVDIEGQVTVVNKLYRGLKDENNCRDGRFTVLDPTNPRDLPRCIGDQRREIVESELGPWNGMIRTGVDKVGVPHPGALDPTPGESYWDKADLRLVLDTNTVSVDLYTASDNVHPNSSTLTACLGGIGNLYSNTFLNNRELDEFGAPKAIDMLEIDLPTLFDCVHDNPVVMNNLGLDDTTEGGLVWYLGVRGPDQDGFNSYGVRLRRGNKLAPSSPLTTIKGLTVVSNQAAYIEGDYNSIAKRPAAILADSINVLSNAWDDGDGCILVRPDCKAQISLTPRDASETTINAAFLAGTDSTGGGEGEPFQDLGIYSGGLHNYTRLHEDWHGVTLHYLGSLVSLNTPRHVDGLLVVGDPQYHPPNRDFQYDTDFNDPANLPPMTPSFVYLKQELFVREFEF